MTRRDQIKNELGQIETGYGLMTLTYKTFPTPKKRRL